MGEPGNGKSICLNYLSKAFNDDNFSTLTVTLSKNMTLDSFMEKIQKKTLFIGDNNKQFSRCL